MSSLDEAKELRRAGIQAPILILGHTPPAMVPQLIEYGITQAVSALAKAEAYSAAAVESGGTLKVHIKVDTGMSRLGFLVREGHFDTGVESIAAACALPGLEAEGIFTHFAVSDEDDRDSEAYTRAQFDVFTRVLDALAAGGQNLCHPPLRQQRRSGPLSGDVSRHGAAGHRPVRRGRRCAAAGPAAGDEPEVQRLHHQDL